MRRHAYGAQRLILVATVAGASALSTGCGSSSGSPNTNVTGAGGSGAAGTDGGASDAPASDAGNLAPVTLYLVGDSTVAAFNDPYYYPRYGYGTQIGKYLSPSVTVNNLALSGRSSKSYIDPADNGNYAMLMSGLKAGDYLMIGFGHNDEKADPSLYTNPNTDVTDPASFQYYLYTYYIKPAQMVGATPILTTPIVRRDSAGVYGGAKVHVTSDVVSSGVTYPGGDYPKAIRDLGAAMGVTVIDNTMSTLALGKQIFAASGAAGTANLQAWVSMAITSVDDTHTNIYGGAYYAYLIATISPRRPCRSRTTCCRASHRPTCRSWSSIPTGNRSIHAAGAGHGLDDHRSLAGLGVRRHRRRVQGQRWLFLDRARRRRHRWWCRCGRGQRPRRPERSRPPPTASRSISSRSRSRRTSR